MIYGENTVFELVRCETEQDWIEQRTKGIGGSDVAALMGLSPWKTPLQLWLEKTGREAAQDISDVPYVKFGQTMEPIIGEWYRENHPDMTVRRVNAMCRSTKRPWAQASLDYEVKDFASGTWGVLEIKTARDARDWQDGVPVHYQAQVLHYLSVTGREYAHVAVFFRDTCEYQTYLVRPDEDDLKAVEEAVDAFWKDYVEADRMPKVQGADAPVLSQMFADAEDEIAQVDDAASFDALVGSYVAASDAEKAAKARKAQFSAQLMEIIGKSKGAQSGTYRVTSVRRNAAKLDARRLKAELPEVFEKYSETATRSGGLRVKEIS